MTLQLAVKITADASSLKQEAGEARKVTEGLGAALDAVGNKATGAAGKLDAAAAASGRLGAVEKAATAAASGSSSGRAPGGPSTDVSLENLRREAENVRAVLQSVGVALDQAGDRAVVAAGRFDAAAAAAARLAAAGRDAAGALPGIGGTPQVPAPGTVPSTPPAPKPAPPAPAPGPSPAPRTGFRPDQWSNLGYQGNDVVASLAMGMPLTQVLMQQGPQVAQILGDAPGGIGGGLKIVGERVASILTPLRLLTGGFVALGATFATLGYQWASSQKAIEAGLTGIGAMSRATVGDINRIAEAAASGNRLSTGEARGVATSIASTGRVDVSNIGAVAGLAPGYARLFGKDLDEAGGDLARIFSDPIKGAEELNARIGGLDASTQRYVRTLVEQGQRQEAIRVLIRQFAPDLEIAAQKTGLWAKAWNAVSSAAGTVGEFVARPFVDGTTAEQVAGARSRFMRARSQYAIGGGEPRRVSRRLQLLRGWSHDEAHHTLFA